MKLATPCTLYEYENLDYSIAYSRLVVLGQRSAVSPSHTNDTTSSSRLSYSVIHCYHVLVNYGAKGLSVADAY